MKTVTPNEMIAMCPFRPDTVAEGRKRLREIGSRKERWSALDVLALPENELSAEDKLWLVLREDFLPARTLHLFACQCAEEALKLVPNPDPRSVEAIRVKRLWIDGKATNKELAAARDAAWDAARTAAWAAVWDAARDAARFAAQNAAWAAARQKQTEALARIIREEET